MTSKIFWFDTETTGISAYKCCVIQLAALIELDGEIVEALDIKFRPHDGATIEKAALDVHGLSEEVLMTFDDPSIGMAALKTTLSSYVNKFDKNDKFLIAGYNVNFDIDHLRQMFLRSNDKYFGSFFFWPSIDVQHYVALEIAKGLRLPNYRLSTVCQHYGIKIDAHEALSDIEATRKLYLALH